MAIHLAGDHVMNINNNGKLAPASFADELYSEFLLCPLCSQIYRQPKSLACQHTFCTDCIEMHYDMDEADRPYRFLLSYTRDVSCPVCRQRTPLPVGGVRRLPDNFLVASLVDVIGRRKPGLLKGDGGAFCCDICSASTSAGGAELDKKVSVATVKCLDCAKLLCHECAELHRRTKVTSQHSLFSVSIEQDVECKLHKAETVRYVRLLRLNCVFKTFSKTFSAESPTTGTHRLRHIRFSCSKCNQCRL